jgi:hypothetical protein
MIEPDRRKNQAAERGVACSAKGTGCSSVARGHSARRGIAGSPVTSVGCVPSDLVVLSGRRGDLPASGRDAAAQPLFQSLTGSTQ